MRFGLTRSLNLCFGRRFSITDEQPSIAPNLLSSSTLMQLANSLLSLAMFGVSHTFSARWKLVICVGTFTNLRWRPLIVFISFVLLFLLCCQQGLSCLVRCSFYSLALEQRVQLFQKKTKKNKILASVFGKF